MTNDKQKQAQVEQKAEWRAQAAISLHNKKWKGRYSFIQGYLAGREVQQREYVGNLDMMLELSNTQDDAIAQLQAQVRELESRLAAGEPVATGESDEDHVGTVRHMGQSGNVGLLRMEVAPGTKLYTRPAQPPAAQVPDEAMGLLAHICDNLADMPITAGWAAKIVERIEALLAAKQSKVPGHV